MRTIKISFPNNKNKKIKVNCWIHLLTKKQIAVVLEFSFPDGRTSTVSLAHFNEYFTETTKQTLARHLNKRKFLQFISFLSLFHHSPCPSNVPIKQYMKKLIKIIKNFAENHKIDIEIEINN